VAAGSVDANRVHQTRAQKALLFPLASIAGTGLHLEFDNEAALYAIHANDSRSGFLAVFIDLPPSQSLGLVQGGLRDRLITHALKTGGFLGDTVLCVYLTTLVPNDFHLLPNSFFSGTCGPAPVN